MKNKEQLLVDAFELANKTIPTTKRHIYVAFDVGDRLAEYYNADKQIVMIGLYLMDIKLKEARKTGRKTEHDLMAVEYAKEFLKDYDLTKEEYEKIINCIEAHHKRVPFASIEAKICANADCYRFIHPEGVFAYEEFLATKLTDINEIVAKLQAKLEEKHEIISLEKVSDDLEEYYQIFSELFNTVLNEKEYVEGELNYEK